MSERAEPEWWVAALKLEAAGKLAEAEAVIRQALDPRQEPSAAQIAHLYELRCRRLVKLGGFAAAHIAAEKGYAFMCEYASGATSGGEGVALSREAEDYRASLNELLRNAAPPLTIITADEMRARGLPPIEISCCGYLPMARFPEPQTLLRYHGPPGGPDGLSVDIVRHAPGSAPFSLDAEIKKNDLPGKNFELGGMGEFEIAGCMRPVRCWSIKPTPWLDAQATAFIAVPELTATVLISFTAWMDDKKRIKTHDIQRLILNSLTLTPKP